MFTTKFSALLAITLISVVVAGPVDRAGGLVLRKIDGDIGSRTLPTPADRRALTSGASNSVIQIINSTVKKSWKSQHTDRHKSFPEGLYEDAIGFLFIVFTAVVKLAYYAISEFEFNSRS
ncbi:hypothetical protein B0H10DRAFT_1942796 [Mycena sp. CBHHK59/15]|nr:hypothetical protein B0H10DRAFT_1942796 [Mycena sp. CBHHK59/15]